jgi:hypothetical protein
LWYLADIDLDAEHVGSRGANRTPQRQWYLKGANLGTDKRFGNDRKTLDAEAEKLKGK